MSEIDPIPAPSPAEQTDKRPSQSVMTKKRYNEIEATLTRALSDLDLDDSARQQKVATIMGGIRDIMKFDPDRKVYTPELGKKIVERRKKRAEELGITVYELTKGHEFYQAHREERVRSTIASQNKRRERDRATKN